MFSKDELMQYISFYDMTKAFSHCSEDIFCRYQKDWLDEYDFSEILNYYSFDDSFKERFFREIKLLKQDDKLNYICFIFYYILFFAPDKDYYSIWSWKSTKEVFSLHGSYMIPVVSLLCGYPFHLQVMETRGFDSSQIDLQKQGVRMACTSDKDRLQMDGIRFSQMIWGSFFMKGNLIQVGRLQYEVAVRNFSKLDQYFSEKYTYIYIHIPRDDRLCEEDVDISLSRVESIIHHYYPELQNNKLAYYTESWLLSPELCQILDDDSNIIRFQRKFRIVGVEANVNDFLNFVFDAPVEVSDYNNLPDKTRLQKGLKQFLIEGKQLHLGIGVLSNQKEEKSE